MPASTVSLPPFSKLFYFISALIHPLLYSFHLLLSWTILLLFPVGYMFLKTVLSHLPLNSSINRLSDVELLLLTYFRTKSSAGIPVVAQSITFFISIHTEEYSGTNFSEIEIRMNPTYCGHAGKALLVSTMWCRTKNSCVNSFVP